MNKILTWFFFSYIFLKPFYLWSSGVPQISDLILAMSVPFFIISLRRGYKFDSVYSKRYLFSFVIFVIYSFIVSISWSIIENDPEPMLYSTYLLFNLYFVILFYYLIVQRCISSTSVFNVLLLSSISLLILSFVLKSPFPRQVVTFNNPNQLASYSMLLGCVAMYFAFNKNLKINFVDSFKAGLIVFISFYLTFISLSAGAILVLPVGFLLLMMYFNPKLIPIAVLLGGVLLIIAITTLNQSSDTSDKVNKRLAKKEESTSIYYERGYDRIGNHPQYLFFGAGEGLRYRLKSHIIGDFYKLELHSTLGTLLFSYGVPMFLYFFYLIGRDLIYDKTFAILLVCMSPYLLTHNLLRHPFLWMFLFLPILVRAMKRDV